MTDENKGGYFHTPSGNDILIGGARAEDEGLQEKRSHAFPDYINILRAFACAPQIDAANIRKIYVPAAGTDTSPSQVFPQAQVTYADTDPLCIQALQSAGFSAVAGDINFYIPQEPADLTCLFNVNGLNDIGAVIKSTKEGGYIIESSWGHAPKELFKHQDLEFIGVVREENVDGSVFLDTIINAADYLQGENDHFGDIPKKSADRAYVFRKNSIVPLDSLPIL